MKVNIRTNEAPRAAPRERERKERLRSFFFRTNQTNSQDFDELSRKHHKNTWVGAQLNLIFGKGSEREDFKAQSFCSFNPAGSSVVTAGRKSQLIPGISDISDLGTDQTDHFK